MSRPELHESSYPTRREFVALGIGAFVVASLPAALRRRSRMVRRTVPVMGTVAEIGVVHRDPRYAQAAIDAAIAELRYVDRTMTRFDPRSEVGRVNQHALRQPQEVSAATALVLGDALRWAQASDGAFDPCLGKALVLWNFGERKTPPAAMDAERFARRGLYRALELKQRGNQAVVRLHDEDAAVDLGGIGKGYAVDRAVEALRGYGVSNALVNAGGDLYALGRSENGDPWKVGIRDPNTPDRILETVEVSDAAIATSGDYMQYFKHAGRRYHHLLDPRTGEPLRTPASSLTVLAGSCMQADAAATALFGIEPRRAGQLLGELSPQARIVLRVSGRTIASESGYRSRHRLNL